MTTRSVIEIMPGKNYCLFCSTELVVDRFETVDLPYCRNKDCPRYGLHTVLVLTKNLEQHVLSPIE